jgi:hypothetical protein
MTFFPAAGVIVNQIHLIRHRRALQLIASNVQRL